MVAVGAAVSTVNVRVAVPLLPARSVTRTSNVWLPSASPPDVNVVVHATSAALSTWHVIVDGAPAVVKVKVGVASLVGPLGPVEMFAVGATVSTVNDRVAL